METESDGPRWSRPNRVVAKPSKVEAIKLASQYLKTYVADEVDNGSSHFTEDAATVLKFHGSYQQDDRDVAKAVEKRGQGGGPSVHGAGPDRRGQVERGPVSGLRPPGPDARQRQLADHDPAGIPAPRRLEGRPRQRRSARSTKPCCRPWRPAATSSATCSAARPPSSTRFATT